MKKQRLRIAITSALLFSPVTALAQGDLTPPGMPMPTMKTLDQVEPRIPLVAGNAGVTTEATSELLISLPGSYFLTGNLDVGKTNGIRVAATEVSIDLMGYRISRQSGPGGNGIYLELSSHRCSIRDGSIIGFASGVFWTDPTSTVRPRGGSYANLTVSGCSENGILAGENWHIQACRAHDNAGNGIFAAEGSTMRDCIATANGALVALYIGGGTISNCSASFNSSQVAIGGGPGTVFVNCTAFSNTGSVGIQALDGCSLSNCTASNNSSTTGVASGISVGNNSTIANCTADANTSSGTSSFGIIVGSNCVIADCTAGANDNTNSTLSGITGCGIFVLFGCRVDGSTVRENRGHGIRVAADCVVTNCSAIGNGKDDGTGAGIHAIQTGNRIDSNHVGLNDIGILADGGENIIIRNTAVNNTTEFDIVANNRYGPIVDISATGAAAVNGSNAPSTLTSADPWANFVQ